MADDAERVREPDRSENIAVAGSLEAPETPTLTSPQRVPVNKTPDAVALEFLALIEEGLTPREASVKVGIHLRTAQRLMSRYNADADAIQAATRTIMAAEALDRVDDWRVAARVGASKRGNHLPAKDWLLHAGIIEPLQGDSQAGIRIAINIGTEDRPMKIASPLTTIGSGSTENEGE